MACGCRKNRGQPSRRNYGAQSYGARNYTQDQIQALYDGGFIDEAKYNELRGSPLAVQRQSGMSTGKIVGVAALLGVAAMAMQGKKKK